MKTAPNQNRKLIFGLIIVAIFGAMVPYTEWLYNVKQSRDLGEAAIGQVDTGSFMLKLALLGGARGIAANVLWTRAEELKREQDWDQMKATVDLITKLQPHFLSVWTFQGWNLAYNVSVEWDAPEDKYEWIKKGIQFLQDGVRKNRKSPDLIWNTAWTYYHKIGFSDESIILRRLFRDDSDEPFKTYIDSAGVQVVRHDNFQLADGWFRRSVKMVDAGEAVMGKGEQTALEYVDPSPQHKGKPNDISFRSMPAHSVTRYAIDLEKMSMKGIPATFGEVAKNAWAQALNDWVEFGKHTWESHNEVVRDGKKVHEPIQIDDETNPKKKATLTENQQYWTNRWADQMNYRYWKDRALAEMTDEGVKARQHFYDGTIAYKTANFAKAVDEFRAGLMIWDKLLKSHHDYRNDDINKKDTGLVVRRYLKAILQLGENEPKDTPFRDLIVGGDKDITFDPFDATEMLGPAALGQRTPRRVGRSTDAQPWPAGAALKGTTMSSDAQRIIRVGHSPDSDDAFMFYALTQERLDTGGLRFVHQLEDIETLNHRALEGELEVSAVSIHAYAYLADRYALLGSGSSMGDRYGPTLITRKPATLGDLRDRTIAVPGKLTTAVLDALQLCLGKDVLEVVLSIASSTRSSRRLPRDGWRPA